MELWEHIFIEHFAFLMSTMGELFHKFTSGLLKFRMQSELCQIEHYLVQWSNTVFGEWNWKSANCLPTFMTTRYGINRTLFLIWFVAFISSIWIINSLHIYLSHLFHKKLLIKVFIRHVLKFQLIVNFRAKSFGDVLIAYGKYMRPIESTYIDLLILCLTSSPFLQVCFINSQFHLLLLFFFSSC